MMPFRGFMAIGAAEVSAVDPHVHVQGPIRVLQRGIEIAMFDGIAAAAEEMTGATGCPIHRPAHAR
jgi:hypothetical protein